ncbi:hypothetical protein B0H12DRAFT_703335 [Mycena haematopus]|nr:hypothetical protein B0H12DRAFT_703335 [Mycena haematopus]
MRGPPHEITFSQSPRLVSSRFQRFRVRLATNARIQPESPGSSRCSLVFACPAESITHLDLSFITAPSPLQPKIAADTSQCSFNVGYHMHWPRQSFTMLRSSVQCPCARSSLPTPHRQSTTDASAIWLYFFSNFICSRNVSRRFNHLQSPKNFQLTPSNLIKASAVAH